MVALEDLGNGGQLRLWRLQILEVKACNRCATKCPQTMPRRRGTASTEGAGILQIPRKRNGWDTGGCLGRPWAKLSSENMICARNTSALRCCLNLPALHKVKRRRGTKSQARTDTDNSGTLCQIGLLTCITCRSLRWKIWVATRSVTLEAGEIPLPTEELWKQEESKQSALHVELAGDSPAPRRKAHVT